MYKVLDVREYRTVNKSNYQQSYGGCGGYINTETTHYTVAICVDTETGKRVRFEFYTGFKDKFLGETRYYGYMGEYTIIVPGDMITVTETSTYKEVKIVSED